MLKTPLDRFDHWSGSACRLGFGLWGLHDPLCPGPQAEKAIRESGCWLRRGDNCRRGAHRLVGWIADAVGLGLGIRRHETGDCLMPRGPRPRARAPGKKLRFAFAVGLAVAAVAILDLYQNLFGFDFGIDRWLVPRTALQGSEAPSFRMINGMPVAIALAGGSLAFSRFEGHHFAATVLGVLAGGMALFALLAYLSGIDTFHGSASVSAPPLSTAVGVLCVASGIILRFGTMPALRTPRPLWHLLIMLGCAIIAPLLLFGFRVGVGVADTQLGQVRKDLTSEAGTLSANVDRQIIGEIEKLQALAASPSLRQGDFAEFQRQAEAALALLQIGNIVLIDRNMQQLVNTFVPFGKPLPKAVVPELLERAFVTR
jgi:hypothetical protein